MSNGNRIFIYLDCLIHSDGIQNSLYISIFRTPFRLTQAYIFKSPEYFCYDMIFYPFYTLLFLERFPLVISYPGCQKKLVRLQHYEPNLT